MTITSLDLAFVEQAAKMLEHSSFLMRVSTFLGRPIEAATERLPDKARSLITQSVDKALKGSLRMAVSTLAGGNQESATTSSQSTPTTKKWVHTAAAMGLGAVSGAAGGWSLVLELPVTTTVMMRSMAAKAQAGEIPKVFGDSADPERPVPLVWTPEDYQIVVTGDPLRNNAYVFAPSGLRGYAVTKAVALPAKRGPD